MLSLRESLQKVEPVGAISSIRKLDDLMRNGSNVGQTISLKQLSESASYQKRIVAAPLSFLWQNTALFPRSITITIPGLPLPVKTIPLYKGKEREAVIPRLIQYLRDENRDIVGLCEIWLDGDANQIISGLSDIYPYRIYGPRETKPDWIETEVFSGGLLLLSRYPIVSNKYTIYRQCCGEDCLSNKGILHARIDVPDHPTQYDIFITHMQSCPPQEPKIPGEGFGNCDHRLEVCQVNHLSSFIQACSSPEGIAFLMGDLNINGRDENKFKDLHERLEKPVDLWKTSGDSTAGITSDAHDSFSADSAERPANDPKRNQEGSRLDYLFSFYQNRHFTPMHGKTQTIRDLHTTPGRDLSDHYGIKGELKSILENEIVDEGIQSVFITMKKFHCLRETSGVGNDSMIFKIWGMAENGQEHDLRSDQDVVDSGDVYNFPSGKTMVFTDPGNHLKVKFQAWEDDIVSETSLKIQTIQISRNRLLYYKRLGYSVQLASPVITGDNAEYVVFIYVDVK